MDTLPPEERAAIVASGEQRLFSDGEVLFRQDRFATGGFWLRSGLVKIAHETSQGQRQIIYVYAPGEWVGYRQIITGEAYPIEATAVGRVEAVFIPIDAFARLLSEQRHFARNLLEALSHEFSVWVRRLTVFNRFPVRERLAICLLFLHERFLRLENSPDAAILFSRTDLADFIGATLETTVRTLSEFRTNGWLEASGKRISLIHPEHLAAQIGDI